MMNSSTIARKKHHVAAATAGRIPAAKHLPPPAYFRRKAIFDGVLAALLLVPGLPIIAFLVLLVRLTSRGPGIYAQVRLGEGGRKFMLYKIRTMRHKAEADSGAVWTQPGDPRVTRVGRVLRKFHLDELPQLFNVLKGEMSLIGPRPERPEFAHVLTEVIPGYLDRLAVRPGVTGLAQLNLAPDSDLLSVRRKLVLDCEYIRRAGPWLDVRLFLGTLLRLFKVPESWTMFSLQLHRTVTLSATAGVPASESNGNGSEHVQATPVSILIQAALEGNGDGNGDGRHQHNDSHHRTHEHHVKPR